MRAGYSALPNPRTNPDEDEMEAAFETSDDEDDRDEHAAERRPLNPTQDDREVTVAIVNGHKRTPSAMPAAYDFENVDYDFPPPGSPPPFDRALPNNSLGNSNGIVPAGPVPRPSAAFSRRRGLSWVTRILPAGVSQRLNRNSEMSRRTVIGSRDGVFSNVTAKPTVANQIRPGDEIYVSPEDAQKESPPSYASAQADAVPPYWETTIHAPTSLSPGMMVPGELPIDGLATGTLFSFLWNMLVSISFQFVGFLLTYLLHTTHAAKLGARAGLGLTLVQYGFALRTGGSNYDSDGDGDNSPVVDPIPSFNTAAEADAWFATHPNATTWDSSSESVKSIAGSGSTEWLAFLLMTFGWFILLSSLLSYWRIKRLERSILLSHEQHPDRPAEIPLPVSTGHIRQSSFARHFERTLGIRFPTVQTIQEGLGLVRFGNNGQLIYEYDEDLNRVGGEPNERTSMDERLLEEEVLLTIPEDHPDRERLVAEVLANERRLQEDLRAAGLL